MPNLCFFSYEGSPEVPFVPDNVIDNRNTDYLIDDNHDNDNSNNKNKHNRLNIHASVWRKDIYRRKIIIENTMMSKH